MNEQKLREMRREFARLIQEDKESFDICIRQYGEHGETAFPPLPSSGRPKVPDESLAMLLADYKCRRSTKEEFLASEAEKAVTTADRYYGFIWENEETLRSQLVKAQKMYKTNEAFANKVDFLERVHRAIGGWRK